MGEDERIIDEAKKIRLTTDEREQIWNRALKRKEKQGKRKTIPVVTAAAAVMLIGLLAVTLNMIQIQRGKKEAASIERESTVRQEMPGTSEEAEQKYTNILLLGMSNRTDFLTEPKYWDADIQLLCSLNENTGDLHIVTLSRELLIREYGTDKWKRLQNVEDGSGKHTLASLINTINYNLDLQFDSAVCVDMYGGARIVDTLGGTELDIRQEEIDNGVLNGYLSEQVDITGIGSTPFTEGGPQHCDGAKTIAYLRAPRRVLYTKAGTQAQRTKLVIDQLLEKAKILSPSELTAIAQTCADNVYSTLSPAELIELAVKIQKCGNLQFIRYPETLVYINNKEYGLVDCLWQENWEDDLLTLHKALYPTEDYQVSDRLKALYAERDELFDWEATQQEDP